MTELSVDELVEADESLPIAVDNSYLAEVVDKIRATDKRGKWVLGERLEFEGSRWVPPAVSNVKKAVLYVALQDRIPRHVERRLKLARDAGFVAYIALPIASLYRAEVLELMAELDANVYVVDDRDKLRRYRPRHFMAAMADLEVPAEPTLRRRLGRLVWDRLSVGTSQERGKRLEAMLAYLFSQVADLRVVERNFRNRTQEIDLVLQVDNFSRRAWQLAGAPFILIEAKNMKDKASQQVMSVLIGKLRTKRQTARIALLVSMAGFTEDAKLEELRISESAYCVVMLDGSEISALIDANDPDELLEKYVRRALMR
jgi:Holliday junction resolvase-like predicted endonuclease